MFGYTGTENECAALGGQKQEITVTKRFLILMVGLCSALSAAAEDTGFLTDYSLLKARKGDVVNRVYIHPDAAEKLKGYNAILVDQPEIFISPDSKYKGAKPDQLKMLADTSRLAMMERLEAGGYTVADDPGPGVLYLRWAISDLYLKKKKRGFLSYTPVGMVVHSTKQAAIKDLWKKIDIVELGLEAEFADAVSGEIIAAGTSKQGMRKGKDQEQDLVTWEELDAMFRTVGERARCSLDNARLSENQRQVCSDIVIEPEEPEDS